MFCIFTLKHNGSVILKLKWPTIRGRLAVLVGGTKSIENFDQKRKMPKTYTESRILYHPGPSGDFVPPFLL